MEQAIFLSVIIPVYNGEKYIVRIMEMLEKQSFRQFEVIIVDDGSEDRSYDICKEYEKNIVIFVSCIRKTRECHMRAIRGFDTRKANGCILLMWMMLLIQKCFLSFTTR